MVSICKKDYMKNIFLIQTDSSLQIDHLTLGKSRTPCIFPIEPSAFLPIFMTRTVLSWKRLHRKALKSETPWFSRKRSQCRITLKIINTTKNHSCYVCPFPFFLNSWVYLPVWETLGCNNIQFKSTHLLSGLNFTCVAWSNSTLALIDLKINMLGYEYVGRPFER